ncbi:thiol reductant ABC exporter subunit CydD [Falsiroseomonas selenitidurans]|uniref:Thiol reductant ABC exporter subunit CydD n=1 Tax=Falsiroseomonas selenitidurans TaxID=2716335 RepID=A0ABX1E827_9PROT|nr:thiol reductant ABC exporter subunit CydD [Falsiroseomonas selenitidurans]NKC33339.1 thiol reductant ABC exporter subunit CydD [Falsiroseomonas selenitidurans]
MARSKQGGDAASALLQREARAARGRLGLPLALGVAQIVLGIAQAWVIAGLIAGLLGHGAAGWPALGAAAALALVSAGLGVAQERALLAAGEAAKARLRAQAFDRLLALGAADPRPVGERAALVVDRIEALEGFLTRWLPAAALAIAGPILVAGAGFAVDATSGAILLVAALLVPVAMALTGIGAAQASRRQFAALDLLSGRFLDRMRGLPTLVLFRRQEAEAQALGRAAEELRQRTMRVLRVAFLSSASMEALAAGAIACLAIRHAAILGQNHPDPAGALFCLLLVPALFTPLRAFSQAYHERLGARGAAAELAPLLAVPAEGGLVLEEMPRRLVVSFQDVRLTYDPTRPPALDGLSFRVLPGETLVLAGPSGAGKSSVLRLLMGFRRPDSGRISLNGQDATKLAPAELRRLSAYVGQRAHLFRATIRENIALARPEATAAQVEAAAAAARVTDFAKGLPLGLETLVGEGGYGLSGGQAQRVAIARAFLRDTPLVLLDEPTAHLDPGTEAEVLDSLRRLCTGRTAIVASHSRAAQRALGRVLAIEAGRAPGPRMAGE